MPSRGVRRPSGGGIPSGADSSARVTVPKLNKDPIWSLQPWPTVVELGGRSFEIPALTATDWLVYLMQPEPDVEALILDLFVDIDELLMAETITLDDLYDAVLLLISTVSARPWWVSLRLINVARNSWAILGPMMLETLDASHASISAWLDVLMIKALNSMDPKDTTLFTSQLEAPPPSEQSEDPMDDFEMDASAFLSFGA